MFSQEDAADESAEDVEEVVVTSSFVNTTEVLNPIYVIDGDDLNSIQEKSAALSQEAMKIGEKLYQQEQENNQQNEAGDTSEDLSGDDVVDADYEEVKEDKEEASN